MRRWAGIAIRRGAGHGVAAAVALGLVASAAAAESTIIRGIGIGKVRVGMTRAQVEHVLGKDALVNARTTVAGTQYLELGWNFSTLSVGFLRQGATYRVAQVETTIRGEKTVSGIGVGSTFKAAARAYPQAICTGYFTGMGSTVDYGPGVRDAQEALVVAGDRKQLAFLVRHQRPTGYGDLGPWVVYGVIVRNSIPGAVDFPPDWRRCRPGWRERGEP